MNKSVFIHIGPPKTGTSAIQYSLHQNREYLQSEGIDYPNHELGPNGVSSGNMTSILSMNIEGKWNVCEQKVKDLLSEFEASNFNCLLLSSEYFFYLAKEIAEEIPQAKFIAYLRCPLETFESSYNQSVKRHMRMTPIEFGKNLHVTTLNILSETIESIGEKRFIIRAYLPLSVINLGLIDDFCEALNLPSLPQSQIITNHSYSFEALEFKRWLNQFNLKKLDVEVDQLLQAYSNGNRNFSFLPNEQFLHYRKQSFNFVRAFVQKYKVANDKLLLEYLKNRDSSNYIEQKISNESLLELCSYILKMNPTLYKKLCNELAEHKNLDADNRQKVEIVMKQWNIPTSLLTRILMFRRKT